MHIVMPSQNLTTERIANITDGTVKYTAWSENMRPSPSRAGAFIGPTVLRATPSGRRCPMAGHLFPISNDAPKHSGGGDLACARGWGSFHAADRSSTLSCATAQFVHQRGHSNRHFRHMARSPVASTSPTPIETCAFLAASVSRNGSGLRRQLRRPVSGRVTLDDQPLANAVVLFEPITGNTNPGMGSVGRTDSDGRFVLRQIQPDRAARSSERIASPSEWRPLLLVPKKAHQRTAYRPSRIRLWCRRVAAPSRIFT